MPIRLVALASGNGTNFAALAKAVQEGRISGGAFVGLVVDRPGTGAARHAAEFGIPVRLVDFASFADRAAYNRAFHEAIASCEPDLICAAGYMRILPVDFVRRYSRRILNIHPSLLPSFPGLHAQRQALQHGVKVTGCTVHFVDEDLDAGPIVVQRTVDVPEGADEEALTALIRREEHPAYIEAVRLFCSACLRFEGRRVIIDRPVQQS